MSVEITRIEKINQSPALLPTTMRVERLMSVFFLGYELLSFCLRMGKKPGKKPVSEIQYSDPYTKHEHKLATNIKSQLHAHTQHTRSHTLLQHNVESCTIVHAPPPRLYRVTGCANTHTSGTHD